MIINDVIVDGSTLWVPSAWVGLRVLDWPLRLNRYRVWKAISAEPNIDPRFDFAHAFDAHGQRTWASVMYLLPEKWAELPLPMTNIHRLTTPKAEVGQWLPRQRTLFSLVAYRWQGEIELCAYRMGLLHYAARGRGGEEAVGPLWSRAIQTMPVLAVSVLYSMDSALTQLFEVHHDLCQDLPTARGKLAQFFEAMA